MRTDEPAEELRERRNRDCSPRGGLADPKAERIALEGRRPIGEHIDAFIASMTEAKRNAQHVATSYTWNGFSRWWES